MYKKERLKNYALWYYLRYYPSTNRLREKLLEKSDNNFETSNEVISEMKNIITEKEVIRSKISIFLNRNKNLNYIKQKLREKKFDKEVFEQILYSEFVEEDKSLLSEGFIIRKILNLKNKWKSKNYIKNKLIERSEDKEVVEKNLEEIFIDGEFESIQKEYDKIKDRYPKEKCIQKLIWKGFYYSQVKEVVET